MNYFLDCGTHFFEGLKEFNKHYRFDHTWTIHSFEANPITYQRAVKLIPKWKCQINLMNIAVSDKKEVVSVHCDSKDGIGCGQGSNILENPPDKDVVYHHGFKYIEHQVPSISFVDFINSLIDIEQLIVKMDIEGSEYRVLQQILDEDLKHPINKLYVEFHERFFPDIEKYINLKHDLCEQLVEQQKVLSLEMWR